MARNKKTQKYVLSTPKGVLNEVKFSDFDDDPEIGREKAYNEALKLKDNWVRNASHLIQDQSVTITEE